MMRFNRGFMATKAVLTTLVAAIARPFRFRNDPIPQPVPLSASPVCPVFRAVDKDNERRLADRLCKELRTFYGQRPRPWHWKGAR